jgi:hypothetical protein
VIQKRREVIDGRLIADLYHFFQNASCSFLKIIAFFEEMNEKTFPFLLNPE